MKILPASLLAILLSPAALAVPIFGPASPVAELNTFSGEQLTDLSADGLTAILQSDRDSNPRFRMFSSTRATLNSPWSTPSNTDFAATNSTTNVGHGILSADGLSLLFQENPHILKATRASVAVPFSAGIPVPELVLALPNFERPGKLSADGLRLYFEVLDGVTFNTDLYFTSRTSLLAPWATPTQGPFAANVNTPGSAELEPYVTPDELQLFFASNRAGSLGDSIDIWWSSRISLGDPFSAPVNVVSLNTFDRDRSPELRGSTLFFTTDRNGTSDVFTAPLVPEPGSLALLLAGCAGLLTRRVTRRS